MKIFRPQFDETCPTAVPVQIAGIFRQPGDGPETPTGSHPDGPSDRPPRAFSCSSCNEFCDLLHDAVQTIRQQHSKFRALESSLDAQVHAALRELQVFEYICRDCIESGHGLTDQEVTDLAHRLVSSGHFPDRSAVDRRPTAPPSGLDSAADLCILGFTYGSPMRVIPDMPHTVPSPESDGSGSDMYEDLTVDDDTSMSLDSSSASD